MERLKPARDPFFLEHQVTFVLIPAFLAAVMIAQTSAGILGSVAVVLTIFLLYILYRSRQRARIPFWRARDAWEKAEKARYERSLLERRDNLLNLAPRDLEHAVTHLFSTLGYDARVTRATGDGGWDVDLVRDGERTIVECKRYAREKPVGRPVIQKLHSAMITEGAQSAICVTTSWFTAPAIEFARDQGIILIDGVRLGVMMAEAYGDKHDKFVYGLCRICGETAPFEPDVGWPIRRDFMFQSCPNGHMVKHPFVIDEHPVVRHAQKELEAAGTWTIG